jgi:hypothetical protein
VVIASLPVDEKDQYQSVIERMHSLNSESMFILGDLFLIMSAVVPVRIFSSALIMFTSLDIMMNVIYLFQQMLEELS